MGDLTKLAEIIMNQTSEAPFPQYDIKDNTDVSLDCLKIIRIENEYPFWGVSHHIRNKDSDPEWRIRLVKSTSASGPWECVQDNLIENGTMGYLYHDRKTGFFIIAYENMLSSGNNINIKFYSDITSLEQGSQTYATSLYKRIHTPASPNTYTVEPESDIHNVGTPNIISTHFIDNIWNIYIRFHFTTEQNEEGDIPGYGVVTFNPNMEYEKPTSTFFNWQGYFDNYANNAINIAREGNLGKVGQRDLIQYNGKNYYLYEAQENDDFNWMNWRLFLYCPTTTRVIELDTIDELAIHGITSIANPLVLQCENKLIITLFIPSVTSEGIQLNGSPGEAIITRTIEE